MLHGRVVVELSSLKPLVGQAVLGILPHGSRFMALAFALSDLFLGVEALVGVLTG